MISSKLVPFFKYGGTHISRTFTTTARRSGGHNYVYRDFPKTQKRDEIFADVCGAFMWWWIFWHVFTDYHHLTGHYEFPCVEKWTDEELGIPSDDADDPE